LIEITVTIGNLASGTGGSGVGFLQEEMKTKRIKAINIAFVGQFVGVDRIA
jgi:hypothetical protein